MKQKTHLSISDELVGSVINIEKNSAQVELELCSKMAADETGLVHGGFIFGLADYAAMLAVNKPNVVLGKAEVLFLKPVIVREKIKALAVILETKEKKYSVKVDIFNADKEIIFTGKFTCIVLEKNVL